MSYLHSGVIDTAVLVTALSACATESDFSIKKLCSGSFAKQFNKVGCTTNYAEYLREFEAIYEKALTQGRLLDEKIRSLTSRVKFHLSMYTHRTELRALL
jgi:hypothetical protein